MRLLIATSFTDNVLSVPDFTLLPISVAVVIDNSSCYVLELLLFFYCELYVFESISIQMIL